MNTSDNSGFFVTGDPNLPEENSKYQKQNDGIVPIDRIATERTNELLTNLPSLWTNYKTEYVEKGLNKLNAIKFRIPAKKKGDYFEKLGFDYRTQIWFEGDLIDTYKDIEGKIEKWSKPFEDLTEDLQPIMVKQMKLNSTHSGFKKK